MRNSPRADRGCVRERRLAGLGLTLMLAMKLQRVLREVIRVLLALAVDTRLVTAHQRNRLRYELLERATRIEEIPSGDQVNVLVHDGSPVGASDRDVRGPHLRPTSLRPKRTNLTSQAPSF
jgi:hypothetical protein